MWTKFQKKAKKIDRFSIIRELFRIKVLNERYLYLIINQGLTVHLMFKIISFMGDSRGGDRFVKINY